jgi:hypothetical protein
MFCAAFYKGNKPGIKGLFSRLIKWWERGQYSHCELVFSDGVAASSSLLDGGVRFKEIDFKPDKWDFIDLPSEKEQDARQWFTDHEGEGYDAIGNIRFALDFLPDDPKKWFCSEALAAALGKKEPWRYGPNGLAASLADSPFSFSIKEASKMV